MTDTTLLSCTRCEQMLPEDHFYRARSQKRGRNPSCKKCLLERNREYRKTRPEYAAGRYEAQREWYQRNKEGMRAKAREKAAAAQSANPDFRTARYRETTYGISPEDFELMVLTQNNQCAICGKTMRKVHIDHDHHTGKVRGLLCPGCNTGLGKMGDSIAGLRAAIAYLEATT